MTTKRLSDVEIKMRVVPTILRWPAAEIAKTTGWEKLRSCVDALRGLVFAVEQNCTAAETDRDLNPEGIARKRAAVGKTALAELAAFQPFQTAERAVAADVTAMEKHMVDLPGAPTNAVEAILQSEIRAHGAKQTSPHDFVLKNLSDSRVVAAVLHAPAFLSGLGDAEWNLVRERAKQALHPTQVEMTTAITKALAEVKEGVASTKRILLERCDLREDSDGEIRHISEPQPKINLTAKAKEAKAAIG